MRLFGDFTLLSLIESRGGELLKIWPVRRARRQSVVTFASIAFYQREGEKDKREKGESGDKFKREAICTLYFQGGGK